MNEKRYFAIGQCGFTLAWAFFISSSVILADAPSANELLTDYETTVGKLSSVYIKGRQELREQTRPFSDEKVAAKAEVLIIHDERYWKVTDFLDTSRTIAGKDVHVSGRKEFLLLKPDETIEWSAPGDWQEKTPKRLSVQSQQENRDAIRRMWLAYLHKGEVVFGRIPGDDGQALWEFMRDAATLEVVPEQEEVGGVRTWVLKSQSTFGRHTLWLDPQAGCLPRRIEVTKQLGNRLNSDQLGVVKTNPTPIVRNGRATGEKQPALQEVTLRIDSVQIDTKCGFPMIMGFECASAFVYQDGTKSQQQENFGVLEVEIDRAKWPENLRSPSIVIPDGTPIDAAMGREGTRNVTDYEWRDGRVARK